MTLHQRADLIAMCCKKFFEWKNKNKHKNNMATASTFRKKIGEIEKAHGIKKGHLLKVLNYDNYRGIKGNKPRGGDGKFANNPKP